MESHKRSIVKSVSWRCFGAVFTTLAGWLITGSLRAGLAIGAADFVMKIGTYYAHERVWQKIQWGILDADTVGDTGKGI
jgi:uncharacterized membrane protein